MMSTTMNVDGLGRTVRLYGRFEKVDELSDGTIKVHGIASTEAMDDQNEIIRASAMQAAIPAYMKFANIREMHGPQAAGRAVEISVDPDRVTRLVAHVVDPVAVLKVKHGVYNGFSVGGRVTERDPGDNKIITALQLFEISMVDRPANPEAIFDCWKIGGDTMPDGALATLADTPAGAVLAAALMEAPVQIWDCGDTSHKHSKKNEAADCIAKRASDPAPTPAETAIGAAADIMARAAAALEKKGDAPYGDVEYADPGYQSDGKKRYPVDTERHIRAAWSYFGKPKNSGKYSSEDAAKIKAKIVSAWKAKIDKDGPPSAEDDAGKSAAEKVIKALTDAGRVAHMIMEIDWLCDQLAMEASAEGDDSDMSPRLQDIRDDLCDWIQDLVAEEAEEVKDGTEQPHGRIDPFGPMYFSAHIGDLSKVLGGVTTATDADAAAIAKAASTKLIGEALVKFVSEIEGDAVPPADATVTGIVLPQDAEGAAVLALRTVKALVAKATVQEQRVELVDLHAHILKACATMKIELTGEDKQAAGKRLNSSDQQLADMAYHAAVTAGSMDGTPPAVKDRFAKVADHMKAVGANATQDTGGNAEEAVPQGASPGPSGDPQANATQDTGRNATTAAPQGGMPAEGGNGPQEPDGAIPVPQGGMPANNPDRVALFAAVESLAKRGGYKVLADVIHDCVGKMTDGSVCQAAKAGARHSKATMKHLMKAHDHVVKMGASCPGAGQTDGLGSSGAAVAGAEDQSQGTHTHPGGGKAAQAEDLQKRLNATETTNAELTKTVAAMTPLLEKLMKRVEDIAQTPMPPAAGAALPPGLRIVEKGDDATRPEADPAATQIDDFRKAYEALPAEEKALLGIMAAQQRPMKVRVGGTG